MPVETLSFKGRFGDISAKLHTPPGPISAYAIFAHCFTCSKDLKAVVRIAEALEKKSIAVLRFDFAGLGRSAGDFSDTSFSSNVEDLVTAAAFLKKEYRAPEILIGHSLGGAAVLSAAPSMDSIKAVVTIGAPAEAQHVEHLFDSSKAEIEKCGVAQVSIGGRPFSIRKEFLDDLREQSVLKRISEMQKALLVCHAPRDQIVGIENAQAIFIAAKHPKSFLSLDNADHLLSRSADAEYVAENIGAWVGKFVEPPSMADKGEVVVTTLGSGFASSVVTDSHRLRADEPTDVGGTHTGPSPYGYLLGALGACTGMTLKMYAERKKLSVKKIVVRLTHKKVERESKKVDVIERSINLEGELTEEVRERMLQIADMCPVHKTLHGEVDVESRLV